MSEATIDDTVERDFVHLHIHSHYSLLEAIPKIGDLVTAAKEAGHSALALTDMGNMYGAIEFYKECVKEGIKPILGVDFFVAARTRHDKELHTDDHQYRIILLAKDNPGYHNLVRLVSTSYVEGFFERPRIDRELIEKYQEGLICILPAIGSEHSYAFQHDTKRVESIVAWYKKIFGEDCYLEISHHPEIEGHEERMKKTVTLSKETGIALVAAHEVAYMTQDDAIAREMVVKIKNGGSLDRAVEQNLPDFSFATAEKLDELFKNLPEALANTKAIADKCTLEIPLGKAIFPQFPLPPGQNDNAQLRILAEKGIIDRGFDDTPELRTRMDYELGIIEKKAYASYFLIVADLLQYASSVGIITNTRGSAAGSLVSYLCGITTVDPIKFQMPFERFLNPERPSAPDIDMDIADNRRDDLIEYARQKYGDDHVIQIGTFGTMAARAAVRDVSRALGHSYGTGDRLAKMIPFGKQGFTVTIKESIDTVPELKTAYKKDPVSREILDLAQKIEGNARHVGVHAAGVVIAPGSVTDYAPIQPDPKGGKTITQYDMYSIADEYGGVGLLKFDFLGLTNLAVLADAKQRVKERLNVEVNLNRLPMDDKKVYDMLTRGETLGVFQMAGSGMTAYLKDLQPTVVHDLNAMVALYRPGPMAFIPEYIERKKNPARVRYLDPRMEKILKPTYGVLIYQDDVMMMAVDLAGYSWGEADKFRKAMGKKIPEEMAAQKDKFQKGCLERGMKPAVVTELWQQIETFAAYGFNKCVTGDTLLERVSANGTERIAIQDIRPDDRVLTLDEKTGTLVPQRVKELIDSGVRDILQIKTSSGKVIRTTGNHPYLVQKSIVLKKKPRLGIFFDGSNMFYAQKKAGWSVDLRKLQDEFQEQFDISFLRYYAAVPNRDDPAYEKTSKFLEKIRPLCDLRTKPLKYIRDTNADAITKKGDMDVDIALDVTETIDALDVVLIISGDSDLAPLREYAQNRGKRIAFAGFRTNAAWELVTGGTFLPLEKMRTSIGLDIPSPLQKKTPEQKPGVALVNSLYRTRPRASSGLWTNADTISTGQYVASVSGNKPIWDRVIAVQKLPPEQVYDVEIEETHTFVANGIIAHNSHAASYGNLAYTTAYMKANYPVDYMAAVLTADAGEVEKIAETVAECKRMKIEILPPSVNESGGTFTVVDDNHIRFGLYSIKNFGTGVADSIIAARTASGRFHDVGDFLSRVPDKNLNKRQLESLIKCGAMDELGERGALLASLEALLAFHKEHTKAPDSQTSLFGASTAPAHLDIPTAPPALQSNKLEWEKELLGLYVSGHPLDKHRAMLEKQKAPLSVLKEKFPRGVETVIAGFLSTTSPILTKKGDKMLFGELTDYTGGVEIVVFPKILEAFPTVFNPGTCIALKGKFSERNGQPSFMVDKAKVL